MTVTYVNGRIFDGAHLHEDRALRVDSKSATILPVGAPTGETIDVGGDILSPGFVDLQVNGGGGVMLNDAPSSDTLIRIARAHRALGSAVILPTLITDRAEVTQAAIEDAKVPAPGMAGLHLEGPHLDPVRAGAHDPHLIRAMAEADLVLIEDAARHLPFLKVTLAPEAASLDQVRRLVAAGVCVALGHTDADFATCQRYFAAGARVATHLFNAMSQLGSRTPGLVGAALANGGVHAGLIADGIHVHPATLRTAWAAKTGPGALFLVSDAMAVAGTDEDGFDLGGRRVSRADGALRLADGTLAGADLDLLSAVRILVTTVGVPLADALQAAITTPAALIGHPIARGLHATDPADILRISHDLTHFRWLAEKDTAP